ncbi:transketolase [Caproiciproducens sp. NJN-50]|uniref:transketolase n=1 Tax=Acutalibacteraceae TaxID=3082771 RepID=UPI000FFE2782|nr:MULTISPECIES: transketolase [Acutalibacteraceae]QAT50293.1 transketolase [Caproiciproducens sp. NJN-50]
MANAQKIRELEARAKEVRKNIITMIYQAQSGHPGGSLSAADIMTALYFSELRLDPKNPKDPNRDRFVLSKGHVCPVLYTCLALRGYYDLSVLSTLRKEGSILQGHPDMKRCPGVDISTGSLGQGLSVAAGMAIAGKRDHKDYRVFCLLGDGESDEGQIWEAAETASKYQLNNLIVFLDRNRLQNDGVCAEIMPNLDLEKKFEAFGFESYTINGHDMKEILNVLDKVRDSENSAPKCIVAETVKGKGVSYMENVVMWHGMAPNEEQYLRAMQDLEGGF